MSFTLSKTTGGPNFDFGPPVLIPKIHKVHIHDVDEEAVHLILGASDISRIKTAVGVT